MTRTPSAALFRCKNARTHALHHARSHPSPANDPLMNARRISDVLNLSSLQLLLADAAPSFSSEQLVG